MKNNPTEPKKMGRPPLPLAERKVGRKIFALPAVWEKYDRIGGPEWFGKSVKRAPEPKKPG